MFESLTVIDGKYAYTVAIGFPSTAADVAMTLGVAHRFTTLTKNWIWNTPGGITTDASTTPVLLTVGVALAAEDHVAAGHAPGA